MDSIKFMFPGSVARFRAWMDEFLADCNGFFTINDTGKMYEIGPYVPASNTTREVWNIYEKPELINPLIPVISRQERYGMILATESQAERTTVTFKDGCCFQRLDVSRSMRTQEAILGPVHMTDITPIGDDFVKITQWVLAALEKKPITSQSIEEPQSQNLEDWFAYLHANKHRIRIKLSYIAEKTGYAESTVKKAHSLYMKEHDLRK